MAALVRQHRHRPIVCPRRLSDLSIRILVYSVIKSRQRSLISSSEERKDTPHAVLLFKSSYLIIAIIISRIIISQSVLDRSIEDCVFRSRIETRRG